MHALFSFFPGTGGAGIGTWPPRKAFEAGCRGVIGPVPQPLNMRSVISTNADSLIYQDQMSNEKSSKKILADMVMMPYKRWYEDDDVHR